MIHIWLRTDLDWTDEAAFLAQCPHAFRSRVELWDATFSVPFHVFRGRVAEIARASRGAVEGATVSTDWEAIPDGAVVLPVDDDDWFAPDAATTLEREWDGRGGCSWTATFVEVPLNWRHAVGWAARRRLPRIPIKYRCTTNNYALVKQPGRRGTAVSHVAATRWFEQHALPQLPARLSAMNRTLASQTSLGGSGPAPSRAALLRRYERYRRLYREPLDTPAWCAPHLARMAELMDELELR